MKTFRQTKRVLTGVMAAAVMLSGIGHAAYTDTAGHWAEETIDKWSGEYAVLNGYGDGSFRPDNTITRGAFAGILSRFLKYREQAPADTFSDTAGSSWEDEILMLNAAGVYLGTDGKALVGSSITRQQALVMICRALKVTETEGDLPYADRSDVAGYARGYLAALTEKGCITDVGDDNRFRPTDAITRAEVVNLLDAMVDTVVAEYMEFTGRVDGDLLITSADGAYIKDADIAGDLIIGPGVMGMVELENVTVGGEIRNISGITVETVEPEKPAYDHTRTEIEYEGKKIPVKEDVRPSGLGQGDFRWEDGRLVCTNPAYTTHFGIDVSAYQNRASLSKGGIDWEAVKADGVDFAMVRIGGRGYGAEGKLWEDEYYAQNIDGAMAAGLDTGVYFFSQAITVEEAVEEADLVIRLLEGRQLTGPVAFDWEMHDSTYRVYGIDSAVSNACALAFCQRIREAGYQPMIYCSRYVGYFKLDLSDLKEYPIWYPEYKYDTTAEEFLYPAFYYQVEYWQYSDRLTVDGIEGPVDGNLQFLPVNG